LEKDWKDEISTPALIVDYNIMKKNIETMAKFAKENKVSLRPHVKTHKCPIIGKMQLEAGAKGICVARVGEAEVFAAKGFNDILIANQVVELNQIRRLVNLNKKSLVRVCVDSIKNIGDLNSIASKNNVKLEVVLELDVGTGRNGVIPGEPALKIANQIKKQKNLILVGLQGYEGHLTGVVDPVLRKIKTEDCIEKIVNTRDLLNKNGFNINYLTASNTLTYRFSAKCDGLTEIQPGTYIFNDHHYYSLAREFDMAVTVLGTICNNPGKRIFTVDVGLKAASKDNGHPIIKNYPKGKIKYITEEHCIIRTGPNDHFEIGQKIELYPSHICTTVNLYDFFTVIEEGEVRGSWDILARGKNY
jgi:D-serine deaminase-like pyridoxal phosphate-dependent protein